MNVYQAFRSTPGGTRTPNLLIRRSPNRVHGCPRESTRAGTTGFRVHWRPRPSTAAHREWLPTWLPVRNRRSPSPSSSRPPEGIDRLGADPVEVAVHALVEAVLGGAAAGVGDHHLCGWPPGVLPQFVQR